MPAGPDWWLALFPVTFSSMNDPHVESLTYSLLQTKTLEFKAPPLEFETSTFNVRLESGILILKPKMHMATEQEARAAADVFVRDWEIETGLEYGRPDFEFSYQGATVIDRTPPPGHVMVANSGTLHLSGELAELKVTRGRYPEPSQAFTATAEVRALWERYCAYLNGREPLLAMGYFCLTLLERGDRKGAAQRFRIDLRVLNRLAELTSTRGDHLSARKMTRKTVPMSSEEAQWVESTIKAIIRHLGAQSNNPLSLADLPAVP